MSEPVDLDGIEARAKDPRYSQEFLGSLALRDQSALVAEVRALRAKVEAVEALLDGAPTVWQAHIRDALSGERVS